MSVFSGAKKNFFLIQSVSFQDYPSLRKLALKYPLLNLPSEESLLKKKIEISERSFSDTLPREKRNFLFVLKTDQTAVLGSSQMAAKSGTTKAPSYSLKIFKEKGSSFLQLRKITDGPSYLGGLILDEDYRGHPKRVGKQLSLIRFLFAAMRPDLFENTFHAEVAPFLDEKGRNPFLECFIQQYIHLSMEEIDYMTLTNKEKLFASYPFDKVLFSTLPKVVQESLGKPGLFSQRAAALLEKQNFQFVDEVDPFDGGPYMQAKTGDIPVIQNTNRVFLKEEEERKSEKSFETKRWLWGVMEKSQFKGGVCEGVLQKNQFFISKECFSYFSLRENDQVFISPFQ